MEAIAHNKAFAKKAGVPQSVGREFAKADKGKTFKEGGMMKHKEDMKMDKSQDKAMIKKAFRQHDIQEHKGGKGTKLALKKGGMMKYADGGQVDPRAAAMMAKKRPMPPGRMPPPQGNPNVAAPQLQGRPTMARPMAPAAAPAPTMPMKKGGRVKKMADGGETDAYVGSRLNMPSNTRLGKLNARDTKEFNKAENSAYGKELSKAREMGIVPRMTKEKQMGIISKKGTDDMMPGDEYKKGGRIASKGEHSVQKKSKRGAMVVKMANGGFVKSADGIAKRGKTRGKMC
jgi:hypothetical protein